MNLLDIKPHKVSTDLSGYITYIYGPPKTGKTTFATQMPNHLLLAFERGYSALPNVIAQDITSWGKMKEVLRELKKEEVKEHFKSIIIDTVDIAAEMCQQYICNQLGIESMGEGGFANNSWSKYKKEFEETFRTITQLGYAVVFISHSKETTIRDKASKQEYTTIKPSVQSSALAIIENMADLYGYVRPIRTEDGSSKVEMILRTGEDISCGGRFKYLPNKIDFSYENLTKALNEAIAKEAKMNNGAFVTDQREVVTAPEIYDYDVEKAQFDEVVGKIIAIRRELAPRITAIVDKYLGKGHKVSDATLDQAEQLHLINLEVTEDILNKI